MLFNSAYVFKFFIVLVTSFIKDKLLSESLSVADMTGPDNWEPKCKKRKHEVASNLLNK